jgi:DNA-binding NarL/FixJ family response regulator
MKERANSIPKFRLGKVGEPRVMPIRIVVAEDHPIVREGIIANLTRQRDMKVFDATNAIPGRVLLEREYTRSIALNLATPAALMEGWNQGLAQIPTEVSADFQGLEGQQLNERASVRTSKVP